MPDPWSHDPWSDAVAALGFDCGDDSHEPSLSNMSAEEASGERVNYIVHLKRTAVLSAKQACVISFWAKTAGLKDTVERLAVPPDGSHFFAGV